MATTPEQSRVPLFPDERPEGHSAEIAEAPHQEPLAPSPLKRAQLERVRRRRLAVASVVTFIVIVLLAGWAGFSGSSVPVERALVYFTVYPRDLPLAVTERGALESQKNAQVICEVDDIPDDGINGATILWIVENGSLVEQGDLVVELDSTPHRERLDKEILEVIYARGQFLARTLDYENRQSLNETITANAELAVEMARLNLQQFEDEQGGTFQINLQQIDLGIQQSEAQHQIDNRNLLGMQLLHELGYKSRGDLAQARLQELRATTALERETARRRRLIEYDYVRSKLQLEGALQSAERNLIQVKRNNEAALAQNKVWMKMAEMGKYWHGLRLDRYRAQLERCKIYAPQRGMVAYYVEANRWGQASTMKEGVAVRYRQPILSIPDLKQMQVSTAVHESVVNRVQEGMRATIHVDAFPNRHYEGSVHSMDVLPDPGSWLSSDTKTYKTIVTIDGEVEELKPGMTAVVEIHVDRLTNVLCVPIQAIVQRGEETSCYVAANSQVQRRPLEVGQLNDQFAEIRAGLEAGDQVVLNPSAILEEHESQHREIAPDKEDTNGYNLLQ